MKYRLIKSYPGSPSFGTEVFGPPCSPADCVSYHIINGYGIGEYRASEIENFPEFWEKVEETLLTVRVSYGYNKSRLVTGVTGGKADHFVDYINKYFNNELWRETERLFFSSSSTGKGTINISSN